MSNSETKVAEWTIKPYWWALSFGVSGLMWWGIIEALL